MNRFAEYFYKIGLCKDNIRGRIESGTNLKHSFEIDALECLQFAEQNLEQGNKGGFIDALTNAKRAIDGQIDKILVCFGYDFQKYGITKKLELLQMLGIIAPRIVRKVRAKRNVLEHEYHCPTQEDVEDAVDIAMLFFYATDKSLETFWDNYVLIEDIEYKNTYLDYEEWQNWINFTFDGEAKQLELSFYKERKEIAQLVFTAKDELYPYLLSISLQLGNKKDIRNTIEHILHL